MPQDALSYDLLIVGAGPAGLAAAIRSKNLAAQAGRELSVCVLEKGADVGAHILSGAVIDPIALTELIPDWQKELGTSLTPVAEEQFLYLTAHRARNVNSRLIPPLMRNAGNFVASLSAMGVWLAQYAESLGVDIFPGFAAQRILYNDDGRVIGIVSGDMGRAASGEPTARFNPGIQIHADYTLIAEGARGSLTRELEARFGLRGRSGPQKYGLGLKEVWRLPRAQHRPGLVQHTLGWPLTNETGGGGFVYHYGEQLISVGLVVHLDYRNPHLSPFQEFQRFKTHPAIRVSLEGGERLGYGARVISEGGLQALPQMIFPGGALIGCSAGMVNLPRIKGSHNAMKSGMLAAEAALAAITQNRRHDLLLSYPTALRNSWVWRDLYIVRNAKPLLSRFGTVIGSALSGLELWLAHFRIHFPWTLAHKKADHECLTPASAAPEIRYPKADGKLSFDRMSSVHLSNIAHNADQPCHLQLVDAALPVNFNLVRYDAPEQRYCPAGVYEIVGEPDKPKLRINAENCIHCKTCDIKDPKQNIIWVPPEGGSGPNYVFM